MVRIDTGGNNAIIIQKQEWRGQERVDIRTHWNDDGEWRPTKKGVVVPLEKVEEVINAIRTAQYYGR